MQLSDESRADCRYSRKGTTQAGPCPESFDQLRAAADPALGFGRAARAGRSRRVGSSLSLCLQVREDALDGLIEGLTAVSGEQTGNQALK
jgi:hypothetical protein